ncbi:MAG: SDR family NAD(P)-dependent oxidoreductase [Dehalococcoidia bacterium]|nr:SDR family NAD(P)-dependent oxidoreductase [Dehalococcoidia bacterium]
MEEFRDRVAVVTGGASGIGLALADRAAREGMSVVIADVEEVALRSAADTLRKHGGAVLAQSVDVSHESEVEALAERVFQEFGAVHLFCNNAGVINRERPTWEHSIADWSWVLGVNVWGIIHGIRSFVPRMLASGEEGHIVNTASMAGVITGGMGNAVYDASKHAVVSISESLYRDLVVRQTQVSASVLCPGAVSTKIFEAERNRPADLGQPEGDPPESRGTGMPADAFPPDEVANQVFDAVRENRFYVFAAQPPMLEWLKMGYDRMAEGKNPAVPRRLIAARDAGQAPQ